MSVSTVEKEGLVVARMGSFDAAFLVLVGATLTGGVLMIPLMRAH